MHHIVADDGRSGRIQDYYSNKFFENLHFRKGSVGLKGKTDFITREDWRILDFSQLIPSNFAIFLFSLFAFSFANGSISNFLVFIVSSFDINISENKIINKKKN